MEKDIFGKLSAKDHKYACALSDKIIAESMDTDEWYGCFRDVASLLDHPNSLVRNRAINILFRHRKVNRIRLMIFFYLWTGKENFGKPKAG